MRRQSNLQTVVRAVAQSRPPLETGRAAPAAERFRPPIAKTDVPRIKSGKERAGRLRATEMEDTGISV